MSGSDKEGAAAASLPLKAAFIFACLTTLGSLSLSRLLHIKACLLCGYQRTYVLSIVAVLGLGLYQRGAGVRKVGLFALPMALAALGVALYQNYLEWTGVIECPAGFLGQLKGGGLKFLHVLNADVIERPAWFPGLGSAPNQALVALAILFGLIVADVWQQRHEAPRGSITAAVVLGLGLTWASLIANPAEVRGWEGQPKEVDICRTPYHPPQ